MSVRHLFKKQTNKLNIIFTINNNFVDVFDSTSINFEYFVKVSGNWCEMGRSSCTYCTCSRFNCFYWKLFLCYPVIIIVEWMKTKTAGVLYCFNDFFFIDSKIYDCLCEIDKLFWNHILIYKHTDPCLLAYWTCILWTKIRFYYNSLFTAFF